MRKILILFLIFCLSVAVYAFDREKPVSMQINRVGERLEIATGWMKMPNGEWISRDNRIPASLKAEFFGLLDFTEYGLGVDNFIFLSLKKVSIGSKQHYMLVKHRRDGAYRYPSIREDWYKRQRTEFFLLKDEGILSIPEKIGRDREPALLEFPLVLSGDSIFLGAPAEEQIMDRLESAVLEAYQRERYGERNLYIHALPIDDQVRFLIFEKHLRRYSGLANKDLAPREVNIESEDLFRNFYYETSLESFQKLFRQ